MHSIDFSLIIFLIIVAAATYNGYKKGFFPVLAKILGIVFGYIGAYLYAKDLAATLQNHIPMKGLLSVALAGIIIFISISLFFTAAFAALNHFVIKKDEDASDATAIAGGVLGLGLGLTFGLLFVWGYTTTAAIINTKLGKTPAEESIFQNSIKNFTNKAIKKIVKATAQGNRSVETTAAIMTNPVENIERFNHVLSNGYLQRIFNSPEGRRALNSNQPSQLLSLPAFRELTKDDHFIALTDELGFRVENEPVEITLAHELSEMWGKIQAVQSNPRYHELINDREVQVILRTRNPYAMLNNEKIGQLMEIIAHTSTDSSASSSQYSEPNVTQQGEKKVYRWVDENGTVHYSDKNPDGDD